jgi:hypothetical protein
MMKRHALLATMLTLGLIGVNTTTHAATDTKVLAEKVRKDMETQLKREDPEMASVKFLSMELTPTGDHKYRGTLLAQDGKDLEKVIVDVEEEDADNFSWTIVE